MAGQQAADAATRSLWFNPPQDGESGRRLLTRERVVAEALVVISADGAQALSMRALAARLGVVPGALYRHVRSKEQLYDLVLDAVLAEVGCQALQATGVGADPDRAAGILADRPDVVGAKTGRIARVVTKVAEAGSLRIQQIEPGVFAAAP